MKYFFYFLIPATLISQCTQKKDIDFSDPKAVISLYREYRDNWQMDKAYDLLADTCKAYITKTDYVRFYERPDSIKSNQLFITTDITEINVTNDPEKYARFKVNYLQINKLAEDTVKGNWKYTLLNEKGIWKMVWTEQLINAANYELSREKFDESVTLYELILSLNPYDELAYQGMATWYLRNDQAVRAVTYAQKAVNVDPERDLNYKFLSDVYAYFRQYDLAIGAVYTAIQISPKLDYFINMGNNYKGLAMYSKADSIYNLCLKMDPESTLSWWMKGDLYFHFLNKRDSSVYYYETALKLPEMPDELQSQLYFGYGMVLANMLYQNTSKMIAKDKLDVYYHAKEYIQKALELDPGNEEYIRFLNQINTDIEKLSKS